MNKEMLFRGKRLNNGEWVCGSLIQMDSEGSQSFIFPFYKYASSLTCGQIVSMFMVAVDPDTVGQFTGLCDKNGFTKIFEGDKLYCEARLDKAEMYVVFEQGQFRMVLCDKFKEYETGRGYYDINCFQKTVIGNIHDTPDLAKEESE